MFEIKIPKKNENLIKIHRSKLCNVPSHPSDLSLIMINDE